jgi:hypothetical protein
MIVEQVDPGKGGDTARKLWAPERGRNCLM